MGAANQCTFLANTKEITTTNSTDKSRGKVMQFLLKDRLQIMNENIVPQFCTRTAILDSLKTL